MLLQFIRSDPVSLDLGASVPEPAGAMSFARRRSGSETTPGLGRHLEVLIGNFGIELHFLYD